MWELVYFIILQKGSNLSTTPYRSVPYRTVAYRSVPYGTGAYCTVAYRTVAYRTVSREGPFRSTAQRTVLFCPFSVILA